ncbi:hypothetical protein Ae201684P_014714 [Aphanomyces euteiches]|nr:hypothetical protein Ae201684P_014714 [Aphanomyces euteiches]
MSGFPCFSPLPFDSDKELAPHQYRFQFLATSQSHHGARFITKNFAQHDVQRQWVNARLLESTHDVRSSKAAFKFAGRNRNHVTGHCVTHVLDSETGQLDIETTLEMAKYSNVKRLKKMRRV